MKAEHLTENNFEEKIAAGVTLVDFFATWCGPCRMLTPTIDEIADECDGSFAVYKVDVDEARDVAMQYGIMSVPTLMIFRNGEEVQRLIGVQPKPVILDAVRAAIG